jgi:serine/threonine protein kinase
MEPSRTSLMDGIGLMGPGERFAMEMAESWQRGIPVRAEVFLERHPELRRSRDAVRLIYEEVCLREERGPPVAMAELAERFPQWVEELTVLLDCDQVMRSFVAAPDFPQVGDVLGDFRLIAALGWGAAGRVFLATQRALADRPVVLKLTARRAREHLSLARLQHTHIVPLHAVYEFPERQLRALCMPFLGGATLDRLLELLRDRPVAARTGQDLIAALDAAQTQAAVRPRGTSVYREALARTSYVEAMCQIGICLAEGLHHAHERRLLHLDLKPSNVLLAADAQPFLLDFHLANEPVTAGAVQCEASGGTAGFAAPEQVQICVAAARGEPAPVGLDGRADLYALARLLYVALAGEGPAGQLPLPPLHRCNPAVSVGLADMIHKCLRREPGDRYPDARAFAADLRRHAQDLPLRGVRNRSVGERWRKWRRRRPSAVLWTALLLALATAALALVAGLLDRYARAQRAPREDRANVEQRAYAEALRSLARGAGTFVDVPPAGPVVDTVDGELSQPRQVGTPAAVQADAIRAWTLAIAAAPGCAACYHNRALARAAAGDATSALRDYDRALEIEPHLAAASLNRGVLRYKVGELDAALADFERAVRDGADPAAAHYNAALVLLARGRHAKAIHHLEKVLQDKPHDRVARALHERLLRSQTPPTGASP